MFSIRQKLMLGFSGLLVIVAVIGVMTIVQIRHLGDAIDVILRENYRSVVACQEMKEGLERVDSGIVFTFARGGGGCRRPAPGRGRHEALLEGFDGCDGQYHFTG